MSSAAPESKKQTLAVVGVDGSEASKDALRWAADYAAFTGGRVQAIAAWEWPITLGVAIPLPDGYDPLQDSLVSLEKTVAEVLGDSPAIPVSSTVVEGTAGYALVTAAADADLLVVGSRGHGGFAELLLGSVSEHCARYAPCPVTVVRHLPKH